MGQLRAIVRDACGLSRSIVVRLVAVGILLVVVGAVGRIVFMTSFVKEKVGGLSASHQLSIATYVANDIDEKIKARFDLLRRSATALPIGLLSDGVALQAWLKDRQETSPLFSKGMAVVPADGHGVLAEYPTIPGRGALDFAPRDWFKAATATRTPTIGRPVRSPIDQEPVIVMAAPILDDAGRPVAILAGVTALTAPGFLNLVQENRIGQTGGFLLVSPRDRLFIAADVPGKILAETPPPGVNPLHDQAMAGFRGAGVTRNANGGEELSAIVSVPTTGWFLVARMPTQEAFEAVDDLQRIILSNSLLMAVLVATLVFAILRRILRPLSDAARLMHLMADGTIGLAPLPIARRDEVGEMTSGFNYLLGKLREQEAALRESEARMAHMAHHDALTGLPNRALFQDRLHQAIARAERDDAQFALLYIDLDGFKPINDTHGHATGDEVLRHVAQRLSEALRKADTVARIGGDEFAVLLTDLDDSRATAEAVARKCRDAVVATPIVLDGRSLQVGLSIGIAVFPADGRDASELLFHSDHSMYAVKRAAGVMARIP